MKTSIALLLCLCAPVALATGCTTKVVGGGTGGSGGSDTGGSGTGGSGASSPAHHASCASPAPSPLPDVPLINTDAAGRPRFDDWRDIPCPLDGYLCGAAGAGSSCQSQSLCLESDAAVGGVCTFGDSDTSCDGEGEVLGYGDGTCWLCAPIEAHAAACCAALPGFDCREWPYPADGAPGMVCARHEDCEPGLLCGAAGNSKGYGICQCPGANPSPGSSCGF